MKVSISPGIPPLISQFLVRQKGFQLEHLLKWIPLGLLVEVVEDFLVRFFRETFLHQIFPDHIRICVHQDREHRMIAGQAVGNPEQKFLMDQFQGNHEKPSVTRGYMVRNRFLPICPNRCRKQLHHRWKQLYPLSLIHISEPTRPY